MKEKASYSRSAVVTSSSSTSMWVWLPFVLRFADAVMAYDSLFGRVGLQSSRREPFIILVCRSLKFEYIRGNRTEPSRGMCDDESECIAVAVWESVAGKKAWSLDPLCLIFILYISLYMHSDIGNVYTIAHYPAHPRRHQSVIITDIIV